MPGTRWWVVGILLLASTTYTGAVPAFSSQVPATHSSYYYRLVYSTVVLLLSLTPLYDTSWAVALKKAKKKSKRASDSSDSFKH